MRKLIEEYDREVLLILIVVLGITRWWLPSVQGFDLMYGASQWVLSYDHGLIRRGLVGTIMKVWLPIVTIEKIHLAAFIAYCTFLVILLAVFYAFLRYKEKGGLLFRLILLFLAAPVTIPLVARNLGRFDLFLTMIALLSLIILSLNRYVWLIPVFMVIAMFIHESFLILYAPTILAAILFVFLWNKREKKILITLVCSAISVAAAFLVLYLYGSPSQGYEEFSRSIQSRAAFTVTPLSLRECYYGIQDHYHLASSSLYDAGSNANFIAALFILSPVFLILLNLWSHIYRNCETHRIACTLFGLATLSGLMVIPIATDYGRWLSAVIICNFYAIFMFVSKGILKVEELDEYTGASSKLLFVFIVLVYLLFGPFHDWNPYPYRNNLLMSSFSIISVLLFDSAFYFRWRTLQDNKRGVR